MFNYNINWTKLIKEQIPLFLQQTLRLAWITMLIKPMKALHTEFLSVKDEFIYKVRFNGQAMYLERLLNDKFDSTLRRIYINDGPITGYFLFRNAEAQTNPYAFRNWRSSTVFNNHEYCVYANKVYKALSTNFNQIPATHPTTWQYIKDIDFIWHKAEYGIVYNFIVYVPTALTASEPAIKAQVNYYKLGGRTYIIQYF